MQIPNREIGAAICDCRGSYELGPMAKGTKTRVSVPIRCRPECKAVGVVHTHPGGPVRLSHVDKKSLAKANLKIGCVTDGTMMRCFKINKRR